MGARSQTLGFQPCTGSILLFFDHALVPCSRVYVSNAFAEVTSTNLSLFLLPIGPYDVRRALRPLGPTVVLAHYGHVVVPII